MASLNIGEYGQVVRVNMKIDVSTNSGLNMKLEPKIGVKLNVDVSDGVVVGTVNVTVGDEQYLANEYLEYTIKDGDIKTSGRWRLRGEAQLSSSNRVVGDYKIITVLD